MEVKKSVVATLAYADIFNYPLSLSEVFKYLVVEKPISQKLLKKALGEIPFIINKDGLYCFSDRKMLIKIRQVRGKISKKKQKKAKRIAKLLSVIPTISLIGISGAVAMDNAAVDDDIDFFIVTKTNSLWLTRFLILMLLNLTGNARKRNNLYAKDKICLNMLLDESGLSFAKAKQTLYTAHEIIQMKPIFVRNATYQLFLASNRWVKNYLPNAVDIKILGYPTSLKLRGASKDIAKKEQENFNILEVVAQKFQLWYMKARTRETVTKHLLAFHPRDYEYEIMEAYKGRVKKYGAL